MEKQTSIYTEKQRNTKIKKEKKRLEEIYENMDITRLKVVENLINEAAFQRITLEETREIINRDGVIEEYQNGANQKGIKKSSAVEVYDKMVNTYSKIVKQLCDLLPEQIVPPSNSDNPTNDLLNYITGIKR